MACQNVAAQPSFRWANKIGGVDFNTLNDVQVDNSGNFFVLAGLSAPAQIGTNAVLTNSGTILAKFDAFGTLRWFIEPFTTTNFAVSTRCAVDSSGSVYLTGFFRHIQLGGTNFSAPQGSTAAFVSKFNPNGQLNWVRFISPLGDGGRADCIALDGVGNIYVSGTLNATNPSFGSLTLTNQSTNAFSKFIAKYSAGGDVLWAKHLNGVFCFACGARELAGSQTGCYFVGLFGSYAAFDGIVLTNSGSGEEAVAIAKLDSQGNTVWARKTGSSQGDGSLLAGVASDSEENVFLTGRFGNPITFGGSALTNHGTSGFFADIFVAKYNRDGELCWANRAGGDKDDYGITLCVDRSGNTYVAGAFVSQSLVFGDFWLTNENAASYGLLSFVTKYDSQGTVMWAAQNYGTPGQLNTATAIAVDRWNSLYVGGKFDGSATFGTNVVSCPGADAVFVAAFENDAPVLDVQRLHANALVSWPVSSDGFQLQRSATFSPSGWVTDTNAPAIVGNTFVRTNQITPSDQFFRLAK